MTHSLRGLQSVLDLPYVRQVRRNHGLEHATIHLLSRQIPHLRLVGRSDARGFWLFGDVPTEKVEVSVRQALARLRGGEYQLALHPNCGTNLVTVALLGTVITLAALVGSERERFGRLQRVPLIALGLLLAGLFGQPLGMRLQQHVTTLGNPGDLEIISVERHGRGPVSVHRVETRSS